MRRPRPQLVARLALALLVAAAAPAAARDYLVYYLGGQSNMDGYGKVAELPAELAGPVEGVWIFHGNHDLDGTPRDGRGLWSPLTPGHGVGFASDGQRMRLSPHFGVELTFARRLLELDPDTPIALIKYSRGGTALDQRAARGAGSWDPTFAGGEGAGRGVNQYDHALACLEYAFAARDIDGDGEDDRLIPAGIVWMQGESDGLLEAAARDYEANLTRLMGRLRAALRRDDVPVVIGRISDSGQGQREGGRMWPHGDQVRQAQADFVARDGNAALVTSTDEYGYSDRAHYDSAGYLDLGRQFAEALHALRTRPDAAGNAAAAGGEAGDGDER